MSKLAILRAAFWAAAFLALVMAAMPEPPQLPGGPNDKFQHIAAFVALGSLASFAYPRASAVKIGLLLSLFGALIELVQAIPALRRDSDPVDWIADTAAAALILIVLRWPHIRREAGAGRKG